MGKSIFSEIIFTIIISTALLIVAGNSFAQPWLKDSSEETQKAFFGHEDGNGDGKVTKEEFKGPDDHFDFFDKNSNGVIEKSEAPTLDNLPPGGAQGEGMPSMEVPNDTKHLYGQDFIKKFDFDKDGKVNHDEWEGIKPMTVYADKRWPQFDKNRDGFITIDEAPKK